MGQNTHSSGSGIRVCARHWYANMLDGFQSDAVGGCTGGNATKQMANVILVFEEDFWCNLLCHGSPFSHCVDNWHFDLSWMDAYQKPSSDLHKIRIGLRNNFPSEACVCVWHGLINLCFVCNNENLIKFQWMLSDVSNLDITNLVWNSITFTHG